ncbi:hypothetical protein AB0399_00500 [Streptomyces sp. NPDC088194]|uniref:hypothetical protein n=1 Tax=Streptomyces sp. NPDC088194 TaxID=3154931 RepID=UPI0034507FD4
MPALDGDHGEDRGVQGHREAGAVAGGGLAGDGADGSSQGAGVVVVGLDAGAAGTFENEGGFAELGSQAGGDLEGQGVEGFGEGSDVGLGGGVVGAVQLVGDTFRGGDRLGPRVDSADARADGGDG